VHYTTQVPMLVSRQFDNEVIIANFETGLYYSLIGPAADIWLGLKSGATAGEIAAAISQIAACDVIEEVAGFLDTLLAEGIIAPAENGVGSAEPWTPQFSVPFSPPVLDRFDDLRDLIFLDPVHDVSEEGWPLQVKNAD
jgi:coenzyme PQQ synthesis protein D (PqqD)